MEDEMSLRTVPNQRALASADPEQEVEFAGSCSYFRVLVADDDACDRELTIHCLTKAWNETSRLVVDSAADGVQALEILRQGSHGLLILDWNMPRQDGASVLHALQKRGPRIPVIVVSGECLDTIRFDLPRLGIPLVNKNSMTPEILRAALRVAMQPHRETVRSPRSLTEMTARLAL